MRLGDYADIIKRHIPAKEMAEHLGLSPNYAGFCQCPLHGEKTASMKLYPGSRGWYCFGCHQGGSVIDLVMLYYGLDLKGAIELVNADFQLGLPIGREPTQAEQEEARKRAEARKAKEAERIAREKARSAAFEQFLDVAVLIRQYERDKVDYAPKTPTEEWDERFCLALDKLSELREEAEELSMIVCEKEV